MIGVRNTMGAVLLLTFLGTGSAAAQYAGEKGEDRFTIGAHGGGLIPVRDLLDEVTALDIGGGGGVTLTYWVHRNVGLQAHGRIASVSFDSEFDFPPASADDNLLAYYFDGNVVLRLPLSLGSRSWWFP